MAPCMLCWGRAGNPCLRNCFLMLRQESFESTASLANIAGITDMTADLVYNIRFVCIWNLIFWMWENAPQSVLMFHINFDIKVWQDPSHSLEDTLDIWIKTESLTAVFIDDIMYNAGFWRQLFALSFSQWIWERKLISVLNLCHFKMCCPLYECRQYCMVIGAWMFYCTEVVVFKMVLVQVFLKIWCNRLPRVSGRFLEWGPFGSLLELELPVCMSSKSF